MIWSVRPEVEQVIGDLYYWRLHGVIVVGVEPLDGRAARIDVHDLHPLVEQAMQARYGFRVECRQVPVPDSEPVLWSGTGN